MRMIQQWGRWLAVGVVWLAIGGAAWAQPRAAGTSSSEAVLAYREAANFQNQGAFELAAQEWQKFLKNHGQDPLAPKAQHYLGVCQLQLRQYGPAAEAFEKVVQQHPQFELAEDAYFNLASARYAQASGGQAMMYAKAATAFGELIKKFPAGKYLEEALFYWGESLYADGKKPEAIGVYERLVREFPQSKRRADALYALGFAQEEVGKFADAVRTYDLFLKEFGGSPLAREVKLRKADSLLQNGDVAVAEPLFGELAALQGFESADYALARQAHCLARLEKLPEAAATYARLATAFANSSYAADAPLLAGRCYYRANKSAEARRWLERAVARQDANSTEAAHWLCRLLIGARQPQEAAQLAASELARAAGTFAANLELDRADALYEIADQRPAALELYEKFAADHPQHELAPQALYNAAFTALELKKFNVGHTHAGRFLRAYPKHDLAADVKYVAAECSLQLKDYAAAADAYRQLLREHGDRPEGELWRVRLGLVSYLQKDYRAAIDTLRPLASQLRSNDARAEAQFLIGASEFHLGRYDSASAALAASLEASTKSGYADEALLFLGRSQAKENKSAEAAASLRRLVAEFPNSKLAAEAQFRLGEVLEASGDASGAAEAYQTVADTFVESPFAPYALYNRALAQSKAKQFPAAEKSFTALLERYPNHQLAADARYGRALCRRQLGDYRGALADLDAYLATEPDRRQASDALFERGVIQVADRDTAGAVATLEGLLKADPGYAHADKVLYEIGWALKSTDKHAEAAPYFARLAEQHPASALAAEAWFHVGEDFYDKKQFADAKTAYANCRSKNPAGELAEKAAYKLGWTHFQQKEYGEAHRQFSDQLTAFPGGPLAVDATFMKAECLFRQEKFEQAWPAYQAALEMPSANATMEAMEHLHAAQTAAQLKQWKDAVALLDRLRTKQPDTPLLADVLYELAWAKQNLGQIDAALADYDAAAARSVDHVGARARFMRGELLFAQKQHAEAGLEFQRAMYGYGGDQATPETKNWQAKSGYEAGRCAEVLLAAATDAASRDRYLADAKRCYAFVVEKHPSHELAAQARQRLTALNRF